MRLVLTALIALALAVAGLADPPPPWPGRAAVLALVNDAGQAEALAQLRHGLTEVAREVERQIPSVLAGPQIPAITRDAFADPLGQVDRVARLTGPIEAAGATDDVSGLVASAAAELGHGSLVLEGMPRRPEPGADVAAYLAYLAAVLDLAKAHRDQAFARLTPDELRAIYVRAPALVGLVRRHVYVQVPLKDDREQLNRILELVALHAKVDHQRLARAGLALGQLARRDFLGQMRRDLVAGAGAIAKAQRPSVPGCTGELLAASESTAGRIVIGGASKNGYARATGVALIVDLGGDDAWGDGCATVALAANAAPDAPLPTGISVALDLGGNDTWSSLGYCTSGELFAGSAQGSAIAGCALACDLDGNDTWTSGQLGQGAAVYGVGLLADLGGADRYTSDAVSNGAAMDGIGVWYDAAGDDVVTSTICAAGFALPGGLGLYYDRRGKDVVSVSGRNAQPPIGSTYGTAGCFHGMGLGMGLGLRGWAGGGVGVVIDGEGDDAYSAGEFAFGCGYFFGTGIFVNGKGNDRYEAGRYGIATGAHQATGFFRDLAGDDQYLVTSVAALAGNWDTMVSSFVDDLGNDRYECRDGIGMGSATITSFALFYDGGGKDTYKAMGPDCLGHAGHPDDGERGGISFAVFLDRGKDADVYARGAAPWVKPREDGATNAHAHQPGAVVLGHGVFRDEGGPSPPRR